METTTGISYEKMMRYLDKWHPRIVTICEESKILFNNKYSWGMEVPKTFNLLEHDRGSLLHV